jgi:hypothetical protein
MLSVSWQIGAITLACVALYAGMRSLPVEPCNFLHYGDYIRDGGLTEECGYEETQFFDLAALRFPLEVGLRPLAPPRVGHPTAFELTLFTLAGRPVAWDQIVVSHTEKLHLLVTDAGLADYQHIHPQPAGPAGHYLFELTPQRTGHYRLYLDFISAVTNRRLVLGAGFAVADRAADSIAGTGSAASEPPIADLAPATPPAGWRLETLSGAFRRGEDTVFRVVWPELIDGERPRFEPVMGSFAHVVVFDHAGRGFAHLHPRDPRVRGQDPYQPDLSFVVRLDVAGRYRLWLQCRVGDTELFLPFDIEVGEDALS